MAEYSSASEFFSQVPGLLPAGMFCQVWLEVPSVQPLSCGVREAKQ